MGAVSGPPPYFERFWTLASITPSAGPLAANWQSAFYMCSLRRKPRVPSLCYEQAAACLGAPWAASSVMCLSKID